MSRLRRIVEWLPRDMSLPEDEFRSRHRALTTMLVLHVPVLFAFGISQGFELVPLALELAFPIVAAVLGALSMVRRSIRTFAVSTGLIYCSVALLHLSGGAAESSLHFLIVLAFVFLYRDWFLFLWAILLMGFSYKLLELTQGVLGSGSGATGQPEMALWALMTAGSIASIGLILAWKSAEDSQHATIAALETARERDEAAARRDAYGKMYVNLARRSQSLVDRQLAVIDELEEQVDDPDILAGVFELDHLTTRIRRHGESLLVVADVDLPSRSNVPIPLADVVRGAQSEIEQYRRVDARIDPSISVIGPATRDLVHLLAELLDNATTYSPPSTTVKVHARAGDAGSVVLTVEDNGLGLTPDRLAQANRDIEDTNALDENSIRHLGFRVVARLAAKHDITVRLTSTNGGGVTAWVELPAATIASVDTSNLAPARVPSAPAASADAPTPTPTPSAAPAPTSQPAADAPALPTRRRGTPTEPAPQPAEPMAPAASAPAPAPTEQAPAAETPTTTPTPAPGPAPAPAPVPMSAGFSASGRRRGGGRGSGRRGRSPVGGGHDRKAARGPAPQSPGPQTPTTPPVDAAPPTTPPAQVRPPTGQPLSTGAVRMPKPAEPTQPAPLPQRSAPLTDAGAGGALPALPRRERGATQQESSEEVLDLFGDMGDEGGRSSLGDFQRGQEHARQEGRE